MWTQTTRRRSSSRKGSFTAGRGHDDVNCERPFSLNVIEQKACGFEPVIQCFAVRIASRAHTQSMFKSKAQFGLAFAYGSTRSRRTTFPFSKCLAVDRIESPARSSPIVMILENVKCRLQARP